MSKRKIKEYAEQLEVPYLVHFTRKENLGSILKNGLYPVNRFEEIDTTPIINDDLRLDGHLGGISVSIAFPNSQMFYKIRMAEEGSEWVVLALHPSILWEKECAFCKHNAADGRISCQPLASLKTEQSFQELFSEIEFFQSRNEQYLKKFDPTDVQAEVLIFDIIEPDRIWGIVFESTQTRDTFSGVVGERKTYVHAKNKGLFASRSYVRKFNS